jgi:DNA-directed RNA polymerase subunit RPC12/RpoP
VLSSDEWQKCTVEDGVVRCPACESLNVTMGACAVGTYTVYQEYVCEDCGYEFQAMFGLIGYVPGSNNQDDDARGIVPPAGS